MPNPAEQFNMARPTVEEGGEADEKSVDLEFAIFSRDVVNRITNGRPLNNLTQQELNAILVDWKNIEKALGIVKKKIENPLITTTTPEGKEIQFNLEQTLQDSKEFYQSLNLTEWATELPETIELTEEQINEIKEKVEKFGFNKMRILPTIETQNQMLQKLSQEATSQIDGLEESEQYSGEGIWLSNAVKPEFPDKIKNINRPKGKCYIQLYKDDLEVPDETLGKTFIEARQYQKENNLQGFTLAEYLIFQREFTQKNKKHPEHNNYTWLTDSELPSAQVLHSRWGPGNRRVVVSSIDSDYRSDYLGFRSSAVLEI